MDDPRVLRIITVGLVLAALAVIYFLFTGGLAVNKSQVSRTANKVTQSPSPSVLAVSTASPSSTPTVVGQSSNLGVQASSSPSANSTSGTTKGGVSTLPRTGFPESLAVIFSSSALAIGFGLRKYPK